MGIFVILGLLAGAAQAQRNAEAVFGITSANAGDVGDIFGVLQFTQLAEDDDLIVAVSLGGLGGGASGYHVHMFPIGGEGADCDGTGGHYFDIEGTDIGDLSGKHGPLNDASVFRADYVDADLTLYGPASIMGRSIVIHRNDDDASRWVCANIMPTGDAEVLMAVATFASSDGTAGVTGTVTLMQFGLPFTETSILVDLRYDVAVPELETAEHQWHVHEFALAAPGVDACEAESTGGHFDPYQINKDEGYACDPSTFGTEVMTCELGDTSGKHEMISLSSVGGQDSGKYFFTDRNLPLDGLLTVVERSIVVHGPGGDGARIGCGTLQHVDGRTRINANEEQTTDSGDLGAIAITVIAMGTVVAGSALVAIGWKYVSGPSLGKHDRLSHDLIGEEDVHYLETRPAPNVVVAASV